MAEPNEDGSGSGSRERVAFELMTLIFQQEPVGTYKSKADLLRLYGDCLYAVKTGKLREV